MSIAVRQRRLWQRVGVIILTIVCSRVHAQSQSPDPETPPCAEFTNLRQELPVSFVYGAPGIQSALSPSTSGRGGWMQVEYQHPNFRIRNLTPGVALPYGIFHVDVEVRAPRGEVSSDLSSAWPAPQTCASLSLFPGQQTRWIEIPKGADVDPNTHRIRFMIWTGAF